MVHGFFLRYFSLVPKSGECPAGDSSSSEDCDDEAVDKCDNDFDCNGQEKCCQDACGVNTCTVVKESKFVLCLLLRTPSMPWSMAYCSASVTRCSSVFVRAYLYINKSQFITNVSVKESRSFRVFT